MKCYTKLQCLSTVFLLCFANLVYNAQIPGLYEGDICQKGDGETSHYICRNIKKCPSALEELKKHIHPKICSYDGKTPIVCCPPEKNTPDQITTTTIKPTTKSTVLKSFSATEKCREYSELIYSIIKDPTLVLSSGGNYIKKINCFDAITLITGGGPAEPKEFPHMALLGYGKQPDNTLWGCGGSLISNRFVLTAAHCEKFGIDPPKFANWARLGELDYYSEDDDARPTDYKIVQRIIHPNYTSLSLYHDIALFKLERDVNFSAYVRPICLNTDNTLTPPAIIATGWGREATASYPSSRLLKVGINTISAEECDTSLLFMTNRNNKLVKGIDENSMLCTGNTKGGKDTCGGDSGGPIQIKHNSYRCMYSQIGITSFGNMTCGQEDTSSVYTRVSNYISWIEKIVWPKM